MQNNQLLKSYKTATEFMLYLSAEWAHQFDAPPVFPFTFDANRDGFLCINGNPLCVVTDLDVSNEAVSEEEFSFGTISGDIFTFQIDWPYESRIKSITVIRNDEKLYEIFA